MQSLALTLFGVIFLSPLTLGALPSYIKTCKSSDPDYENCKIKSAKLALPTFVQGDKDYAIPKLNPLTLPSVKLQAGSFGLNFTNFVISGLENTKPFKVDYHFDTNVLDIGLEIPKIIMKGPYKADGKVLILSIVGEGPGEIVLHDGIYNAKIPMKVQEKNGKEYIYVQEVKLDIKLKKVDITLDNLFGGDKRLGDEMNKFLNENWQVLLDDYLESFETIVGEVVKVATKGLLASAPLNEIFPK